MALYINNACYIVKAQNCVSQLLWHLYIGHISKFLPKPILFVMPKYEQTNDKDI